jgi:DNA-binding NtrC family response regulator
LGIIGKSVEIKEILEVIDQVAPTDITVLITGESGTGKEIFAKAIHQISKRSSKPMISVNSGAIPEGIIESELFGHEKGSFTGAVDTRKGYFELADGGTIFLDEIGELPAATQVKFLRILETGEYMRVGSSTPRKANVRVIAATNKELEFEVKQGNFRADLYFRLRSINIRIPPLRERREDIPLLAEEFAKQICQKNKITFGGFANESKEIMTNYHWPGNVRELKNIIESVLILEKGKKIEASDLRKHLGRDHDLNRHLPVYTPKSLDQAERELILRALLDMKSDINEIKDMLQQRSQTPIITHAVDAAFDDSNPDDSPTIEPVTEIERRAIIGALERYKGNRRLASRALNISERTLYRKIKEYNLNH